MSSPLSERLRYIRESQDKIQQDVADFLGITRPAHCSEVKTGKREWLYSLICYSPHTFDCLFITSFLESKMSKRPPNPITFLQT